MECPSGKGTTQSGPRSQLLFAFGKLPIGAIGPNEVQQWISQMAIDGYDFATMRAKRSLFRTILQVAVDQSWLTHNPVDPVRLPRPVEQPDEDRVVTPEEWAQIPDQPFRRRHVADVRPAAPWLEEDYLADRSEAIDPIKYHWFTRYQVRFFFSRAHTSSGVSSSCRS